jgi:hypothetical protein
MDLDDFPPCTCDHDFWEGINFHFQGSCAKWQPVHDMQRFFIGWLKCVATNSRWHRQ